MPTPDTAKKSPAKATAASPAPKKGGAKDKSSKKKDLPCIEFKFEARSKPVVEKTLELEAKRQKSFFGKKTKVGIADIDTLLDKQASSKELSSNLHPCILYYKQNEKDGAQFFETLGRLLLEAASKEHTNFTRQRYILYQALDVFSMAIQLTDKRISVSAQGMIMSVSKILSVVNSSTYYIEKEIQATINVMANKKKDLNDLEGRDKIIKLCMKGKRYYEALYQLAEYEKLMQLRSRSMYIMKAGEIHFRQATVFQHIIDFYLGVATGQAQKEQVEDMGKLRSFIYRFNMDNSKFKLIPLTGDGPLAINKTLGGLITAANVYYGNAGSNSRFAHRHKAYLCMAHNNVITDKIKAAIGNLTKGMETLAKSNLKAVDKGNEKIKFLEQIIKIYNDQGVPRKAEEYAAQLQPLRESVRQMESKKRADDAKRKELMGN
ncbi:MAG: hypothetical protein HQM14_03625 [SAR324 cluster bacterium]|nr:hypothetical protein [SAR324 cluster bacterium]